MWWYLLHWGLPTRSAFAELWNPPGRQSCRAGTAVSEEAGGEMGLSCFRRSCLVCAGTGGVEGGSKRGACQGPSSEMMHTTSSTLLKPEAFLLQSSPDYL